MSLLAWALAVIIVILCSVTLHLAIDAVRTRLRTPERILKEISGEGSPEDLQLLFHWGFDSHLAAYGLSRDMWRKVQKERIRSARKCLRAIRKNIACFQGMALVRWEESAALLGNDETETKALSAEMIHRAARCKVLLKYVEVRLAVTTVYDALLWRLGDPGMSEICEAAGARLVNEYERLVGASLAFCRKHGEFYYEILLFALDSIVLGPPESSTGEAS